MRIACIESRATSFIACELSAGGRGRMLQRIKSALMRDDIQFAQVRNREIASGPVVGELASGGRASRNGPGRGYSSAGEEQIRPRGDVKCRHSATTASEARGRAVVPRRRLTFMDFAVVDQPQRLCKAGALRRRPRQSIYPHCSDRVALHSRYIAAAIRVRGRA